MPLKTKRFAGTCLETKRLLRETAFRPGKLQGCRFDRLCYAGLLEGNVREMPLWVLWCMKCHDTLLLRFASGS